VFLRHEPLSSGRLTGFALVWIALALFTADGVANHRRRQLALAAEAAAA
jgi:chloramphenicol-sensitive protein RarD